MRDLGAVGGERLVMVGEGGDGVEGEVELVAPAELEATRTYVPNPASGGR